MKRSTSLHTLALVLIGTATLLSGCDAGADEPALSVASGKGAVEAEVNDRGGVLELESRARLTLPAGALDEATTLRVETVDLDGLERVPEGYEVIGEPLMVTPHGLKLLRPATIEQAVDDNDSPERDLRVLRLATPDDRSWEELEGVRLARMDEDSHFAADLEVDRRGEDSVTGQRRVEFEVETFSIFLPVRLVPAAPCAGRPKGQTCRASTGDCDVTEVCDGVSPECPGDDLKAKGAQCRMSGGPCDVAEVCDGGTAECPVDGARSAGAVCRPSDDECIEDAVCDGSGIECPASVAIADCGGTVENMCPASCEAGNVCVAGSCVPEMTEPPPVPVDVSFQALGNSFLDIDYFAANQPSVAGSSTLGGTLTVNGDGTLRYEPPPGAVSTTDTIGVSFGTGESITVTLEIGQAALWADASASGGTGTRSDPFGTLAAVASATIGGELVIALGSFAEVFAMKEGQTLVGDQVQTDLTASLVLAAASTTELLGIDLLGASPLALGSVTSIRGIRLHQAAASVATTDLLGTLVIEGTTIVDSTATNAIDVQNTLHGGTLTLDDVHVNVQSATALYTSNLAQLNVDVASVGAPKTTLASNTGRALYLNGSTPDGGTTLDAHFARLDSSLEVGYVNAFAGDFEVATGITSGGVLGCNLSIFNALSASTLELHNLSLSNENCGLELGNLLPATVLIDGLDITLPVTGNESYALLTNDVGIFELTQTGAARNRIQGMIEIAGGTIGPAGVNLESLDVPTGYNGCSWGALVRPDASNTGTFRVTGNGSPGSGGSIDGCSGWNGFGLFDVSASLTDVTVTNAPDQGVEFGPFSDGLRTLDLLRVDVQDAGSWAVWAYAQDNAATADASDIRIRDSIFTSTNRGMYIQATDGGRVRAQVDNSLFTGPNALRLTVARGGQLAFTGSGNTFDATGATALGIDGGGSAAACVNITGTVFPTTSEIALADTDGTFLLSSPQAVTSADTADLAALQADWRDVSTGNAASLTVGGTLTSNITQAACELPVFP
jgi:hypothetical protein